jgi:hypothetical protein
MSHPFSHQALRAKWGAAYLDLQPADWHAFLTSFHRGYEQLRPAVVQLRGGGPNARDAGPAIVVRPWPR